MEKYAQFISKSFLRDVLVISRPVPVYGSVTQQQL